MESFDLSFTIDTGRGNHIKVASLEPAWAKGKYEFSDQLQSEVDISCNGYTVKSRFVLRAVSVWNFLREFESCHERVGGVAAFLSEEDESFSDEPTSEQERSLSFSVAFEKTGHVVITGFMHSPRDGCKLEFAMTCDQSYLNSLTGELKQFVASFPVLPF